MASVTSKQEEEVELRQTHEALTTILSDDSAFEAVLLAVFKNIDSNQDGNLDTNELESYITEACEGMGLAAPQHAQILGIFHQLVSPGRCFNPRTGCVLVGSAAS